MCIGWCLLIVHYKNTQITARAQHKKHNTKLPTYIGSQPGTLDDKLDKSTVHLFRLSCIYSTVNIQMKKNTLLKKTKRKIYREIHILKMLLISKDWFNGGISFMFKNRRLVYHFFTSYLMKGILIDIYSYLFVSLKLRMSIFRVCHHMKGMCK